MGNSFADEAGQEVENEVPQKDESMFLPETFYSSPKTKKRTTKKKDNNNNKPKVDKEKEGEQSAKKYEDGESSNSETQDIEEVLETLRQELEALPPMDKRAMSGRCNRETILMESFMQKQLKMRNIPDKSFVQGVRAFELGKPIAQLDPTTVNTIHFVCYFALSCVCWLTGWVGCLLLFGYCCC